MSRSCDVVLCDSLQHYQIKCHLRSYWSNGATKVNYIDDRLSLACNRFMYYI